MQIHVVGLGVAQKANLDEQVQALLAELSSSDIVLGSMRQHETIRTYAHRAQQCELPKLSQLDEAFSVWQQGKAQHIVVLASGDPLFFGIGAWLMRRLGDKTNEYSLSFYPNVSSAQVACHRLGLSLQDVQVVSLHGRPLSSLRRSLQANKTLVLLTDQYSQPQHIAQECQLAGLEDSEIIVCEALGYEYEQVRHFDVESLLAETKRAFDPLNVVVLNTKTKSSQEAFYPTSPGIPDTAFITDKGEGKGMITKREVRLMILSYLAIQDGDVVWDIGAGCGGLSVELAYWHPRSQIMAIEHHAERLQCLEGNRSRFGVEQNLSIISGRAPEVLKSLAKPNKVFIGGSDGELSELLNQAWVELPAGGHLMTSAVTEETKLQVMQFAKQHEALGDATEQSLQVAVAKLDRLAGQRLYRNNLPVTLSLFIKRDDKGVTIEQMNKDTE